MLIRQPKYNASGNVDCEIEHPEFGWIPFTASADDIESLGREIHAQLISGSAGVIAPYIPPLPAIPQEVSVLAGLAAIAEVPGMAEAYTAWATSPDRTFLERAFIDKAQTWKRNNQTLIDAVTSIGVTGEQMDAMFARAKELEAVL